MKKFLFTLLTLFMASSAFAEGGNYLTMNDYTVVKTKLETLNNVTVGVKAHFDNYVSAMQVWVEVPEGVTLRGASAGNDYGISYIDNLGMNKVATPDITFKDGKFVIASMAAAYGEDETFYGVAKWAPGDYENYLNFVFRCNADFKGGDVKIIAAPACGDDTRPEVVANKADGTSYTTTSALSVEYIAPEPVLTWNENNYSMTAALPEGYNAADYEIVMMANGEVVEFPYTVAQTDKDQTIEFTAYTKHAAGETYDSNDATYGKETKQTVTVPAKVVETIEKPVITFSGEETTEMTVTVSCATEGVTLYVNGEAVEGNPYSYIATRADVYTAGTVEVTAVAKKGELESEVASDSKAWVVQQKPEAPVPTFNWDPDTYTMEAVCQGHTVVLMANGVQVSNPYTVAQTTEDQTIEFSAYTVANADESGNSETIKQTVTVPAKPLLELTGKITFSVTQGNKNEAGTGIVTATYDGPETGVTVKIVGNPTQVAAATSEGVQLPDYGTYQVKAVASATGYADLDGEGEVTWEEPQTDAPEFNVSQDGLTVEATGKGTVKLYIVNADGSETEIDNPTAFDQKDEAYTVNLKAVAHVDGAKDGVATKTITIPAKSTEPGTGVNELVDGKAVKSVRYFNMAGQEMQEVNGVTIVVTTYTDGTTSAVKVMK